MENTLECKLLHENSEWKGFIAGAVKPQMDSFSQQLWVGLTHRLPFQNAIESPAVALDDRPLEEDLRAQPALTHSTDLMSRGSICNIKYA